MSNVIELVTRKGVILLDVDAPEEVLRYRWHVGQMGYVRRIESGKEIRLHRLLMGNPKYPLCVDHINRNKLDNRRCNLRIVDYRVNAINRRPVGVLGVKGVCMNNGKFQVYANRKYVGIYRTLTEAALAYDAAAVKAFGESAVTNRSLGLV